MALTIHVPLKHRLKRILLELKRVTSERLICLRISEYIYALMEGPSCCSRGEGLVFVCRQEGKVSLTRADRQPE